MSLSRSTSVIGTSFARRRLAGLPLLMAATAGEMLAARALWHDRATPAALLHGLACASFALGVWLWLAHLPRRDGRAAAIAALGIMSFLPGLGLIGLALVALPRWSTCIGTPRHKLIERAMPRFSEEALDARALPLPTLDALSPTRDVEARVAAVKALRNMEVTRAIPLLRRALSDPAEDVRLLAHAILDRRERGIRAQLEGSLELLSGAASDPRASSAQRRAHVALASHYWELAYAGFVSGESARVVLEKAAQHAVAASAYPGERVAVLIAIRAYLKLGELERAGEALAWARDAGIPAAALASLTAELAFLQRRFHDIDGALSALSPLSARQPYVAQVMRFWAGRSPS